MTKRPKIQTNEGPPDKFVQISCIISTRPDSTYPLIIKPYKLDLTQFGDKVRSEIKFTIENVADKDLDLTSVYTPNELLDLTLPKLVKAGKTAEGIVKLTKAGIDQEFEKAITISVSDEKNTRFTIPVKRTIRKPGQETASTPLPAGSSGH
ncbi:MAG: hypothetical protein AB1644_10030 [Candidatus Zixiibacteriota bacterium]